MPKSSERWFAIAGVVIMTAVAIAGFAVAIYAAWLFHDLPDGSELADFHPTTSARVFAWDGTLLGEYGQERRVYIPYNRIPPKVAEAFLAAEDRNFFQHSGVDVGGLGRAAAKNVFNFFTGRRFEGGSTITQQVAKNLLLNNERTIGRKLKEVILARRLEASLSKEQILELYLNDIYLGYHSYGVGAAAFNYFGKSVDELSLSEMAYLGALPKGPENYRPSNHKDAAIARRNWVLGEMAKAGWVTRSDALAAQREDLVIQAKPLRAKYQDADYFVSEVERRAKSLFNDKIYTDGYYIKTTLDPRLQSIAREALMNGLEVYDRRHGWRGAWGNITVTDNWVNDAQAAYDNLSPAAQIPAERSTWQIGIVTAPGGAVRAFDGTSGTLVSADTAWAKAGRGLKTGDLVYVSQLSPGVYNLHEVPIVNGSLVAVDPWSGRIEAMVGGYSYSLSKFNRSTQALRQPGSGIKPFIYAAALENDFTPASIIDDAPISLMGGDGNMWNPENYEHDFLGPQPIRKGIELSRNLMTVRLAQQVGMKTIAQKVVSYGVVDEMPAELSMALGAGEVAPYRLATSYSIFVNGGRKVKPHLIDEVEDRDGNVIYKADERTCPSVCTDAFDGLESPRLLPQGDQVLDPIAAYQMNTFLQGVTIRGTAAAAGQQLDFPIGGKTGTTNNFRSAWFTGFTADLVVGVFVGFDDNRTLGDKEAGAVAALPIWIDFMKKAMAGKPKKDFNVPRDAVFVNVHGISEAFKPGTEPKYDDTVLSAPEVSGPKPYDSLKDDSDEEVPATPPPAETPPPPKKDDPDTLY